MKVNAYRRRQLALRPARRLFAGVADRRARRPIAATSVSLLIALALLGPRASAGSEFGEHEPAPERHQARLRSGTGAMASDRVDESPCEGDLDKTAAPERIALGQEITVTLELSLSCPPTAYPSDVVLVVDRSGSMRGPAMEHTKAALGEFLDAVDFGRMRVALVTFSTKAEKPVALTTRRSQLDDAIENIVAEGDTNIGAGLNAAGGILGWAKAPRDRLAAIVLLTDGRERFDVEAVVRQSRDLKDDDVHFSTIGLGRDVDVDLLARLASSRSDAFLAPESNELSDLYRRLAGRLVEVSARDIVIDDRLPEDMRFVEGSARPPTALRQGDLLRWRLAFLPADGISLTYRLQPLALGIRPTNVEAFAEFVDGKGERGRLTFPVPKVEVLRELPSATPTATSTPTPTSSPTSSVTPTPSPSPARTFTPTLGPGTGTPIVATPTPDRAATLTAEAPPEPIFLPFASRRACLAETRPIDIVMVLDASTTMLNPTADGRRKIDAATEALAEFASMLDNKRERLALVVFNGEATVVAGLSADHSALLAALPGISLAGGSRIDVGLELAAEAFASAEPVPDSRPVLILLTDGRPAGSTRERVTEVATILKSNGVTLYALGLDPEPEDRRLMQGLASGPSRYLDVGDGSNLEDVYLDIAGTIGCP